MFIGRLRNHRLVYLLCMVLLVVGMGESYGAVQASSGSITITNIRNIRSACGVGNIIADYAISATIPSGENLNLRISINAPGASSPLNGASGALGSGTKVGPFSGSNPIAHAATSIGSLAVNTIITIRYYNSTGPEQAAFCVNCLTQTQVPCSVDSDGSNGAFNITHFDPADGRIDGKPGDRIVIYCNPAAKPPSIDIYGISDNSLGFLLGRFKFSLVVRAGTHGVVLRPVGKGKINLQVDANNNFYAAWNGGPYSATGTGDFAKSFTCPFTR